MEFLIDDPVVHCLYGMGLVAGVEERTYNESTTIYYKVCVADLTVWVPADENLQSRLRPPSSIRELKQALAILSTPAEVLPKDGRERNLLLRERMKNGGIAALCRVIRDLACFRGNRSWNDYDHTLMKRMQKTLVGEWAFVLSIPEEQAADKLRQLLMHKPNGGG